MLSPNHIRSFKLSLLFASILALSGIKAQSSRYPSSFFSSPLTLPLSLAGNFGELRLNHFHYGLDFRTNGREGYPVLASADGYISRVKISGYGYGKAIYIDHPNGFTTVYGHLSELKGELAEFVKKAQYSSEKFEFEYYPKPNEFPVKKGEPIAFSGNTGGSSGPHLHFEIRETKSEVPINPQLFGFPLPDIYPPVAEKISAYSFTSIPSEKYRMDYSFTPGSKSLKDTIIIYGKGGIGFSGYDKENAKGSKNGIYETIFIIDSDTIYHSRIDQFSFDEARYVNCHVDYPLKKKFGKNIEKTFLAPNNKAPIYLKSKNRGVIEFNDTLVHQGNLILKDLSGLTSTYKIAIRKSLESKGSLIKPYGEIFLHNKVNIYKRDNIQITIPAYTLYDDLDFVVKTHPKIKNGFSPVFSISSDDVPVQSAYILSIKPENHSANLADKLTIVSIDNKGRMKSSGGEWSNGSLITELKTFGKYTVYLDTIGPFIKHLDFKRGGRLPNPKQIRVKAYDNLGDVKFFKGMIDGNWKLFEFDAKSDVFTYRFDEKPDGKTHKLTFECLDEKGNKSVINVPFIR